MTHPPGREKRGGMKEDLSEVLPVYIFQHLHLPDGYPVEPHEAFVLQGDFCRNQILTDGVGVDAVVYFA